MERVSLHFALRHGPISVGEIADAFCGEGATQTWFGQFAQCTAPANDTTEKRARDFVAFCKEWHARLDAGEDVDASEFDLFFGDLLESGLWAVQSPDGAVTAIDTPVFYADEITWRPLAKAKRSGEPGTTS